MLTGLTSVDAAARLALDGPNELPSAAPRNLWQQVWAVLRQPMLLLLLAAGGLNLLLSDLLDGVMLMAFVLVVITISIYQERKTEHAVSALRELAAPRALVVRDGVEQRIPGRDVVRNDTVLLTEGDRVPADGVLLEAVALAVNESTLTGESAPVRKRAGTEADPMGAPGGADTPWIFAGTMVTSGRAVMRVRQTGAATEFGRIGAALAEIEQQPTRLQREVDRLVRAIAVFGLGAAALVVVVYGVTRGHWLTGLLAGIATAMAMLPEEFPVVLTVFMALGAWRMSREHVLARRAMAVEALGSTTVICVDKTGTLTQNLMQVDRLLSVTGVEFKVGQVRLPAELSRLVEASFLATPANPYDPMDAAFRDLGAKHLSADFNAMPRRLVREYPLSEALFAVVQVWDLGTHFEVAAKGAPEAIMSLCRLGDSPKAEDYSAQVEAATADGQRVLAVASARWPYELSLPASQFDYDFEYLGLVCLVDPIRPNVPDAVRECAAAGVRTIMITGDYPGTALAIAKQAGIDHGQVLTGPEVERLGDEQLRERLRSVSVFARMVPQQKLRLVRALQADGHVVAMSGDGVNDAPALRAADIGVAMGARGTDVAREAAALVITDDDFASIAAGVRRGRTIFANLRKAMGYVVAVHIPIVGMSLLPLLAPHWPLVMLPLQIAFLELVIDPACSVVFEAEPADPAIMQQPPRKPAESVLGRAQLLSATARGVALLTALAACYLWLVRSDTPDETVRAVVFAGMVMGNLALILTSRSSRLHVFASMRQRRNPAVLWIVAIALSALALLLGIPNFRGWFGLGPVTLVQMMVVTAAVVVSQLGFEVRKFWRGR